MKGPILLHDSAQPHIAKPTLQKLNKLSHEILPHLPYSLDFSPTDYHFSIIWTTSSRKNASKTKTTQKMPLTLSSHSELRSSTLGASINLFLVGKNVLILMVFYSVLSYICLKFRFKNLHCFCNNLIIQQSNISFLLEI